MSAIAGIVHKDGRPVDPSLLQTLTASLATHGPDGSGVWHQGNAGMGFQANWTTPEDIGLNAPIADAGLVIVMDGRLDNRDDLLATLRLPADTRDSNIALAAFRKWGDDCPAHLLGDFAFAIWQPREQRLFCARDRFGLRPFYYADTPHAFVFASELRAVLSHPAVTNRRNEGMLAELLSYNIQSRTETLFADVLRLEPRHSLSVSLQQTARRCYWNPSIAERRYASVDECAAEFLDILQTAVACRLRRTGPAATFLSGGLDSSTVTALAARLMPPDEIHAFSSVFPGMPTDESYYIDLNLAKFPVQSHRVPFSPPPADLFASWAARYRDFPGYPNGNALLHPLALCQQQHGVRVILGGQGGNQLLDGYPSIIADDFRALRFNDGWRNARAYSYRGRSTIRTAYSAGLRPLLPKPAWLRRLLRRPPPAYYPLHPDFVRRSGLRDRIAATSDWRPYGSMARRDVIDALFSGVHFHYVDQITRDSAHYGIEERVPFLDARLVEFAVQLPERMRQRDGVWKYVMRRAIANLVPAEVANRQVQAEFSSPALKILEKQSLPDLGVLDGYLSTAYLRSLSAAGGSSAVMSTTEIAMLQRWAVLGTAYFLDSEEVR